MTTRQKAIQWKNSLDIDEQIDLCIKYNDTCNLQGRLMTSLTGREIERIYKHEHLKKGVKVQYKDKVLTVLNEVGFIGQRGRMIPCADDDNYIDDYCVDDLSLFSGEKFEKEINYILKEATKRTTCASERMGFITATEWQKEVSINRLKEQYKKFVIESKTHYFKNKANRLEKDYQAMRLFCLDTQLLDFNTIELMEFEVNSSL